MAGVALSQGVGFNARDTLMVGESVSHYRIVAELGAGGMGVVYKAEDLRLGRLVALKFLPPELVRDPGAKNRFFQEARTASALDHVNVCTIFDIEETTDEATDTNRDALALRGRAGGRDGGNAVLGGA